jgi:hypothetical protein
MERCDSENPVLKVNIRAALLEIASEFMGFLT